MRLCRYHCAEAVRVSKSAVRVSTSAARVRWFSLQPISLALTCAEGGEILPLPVVRSRTIFCRAVPTLISRFATFSSLYSIVGVRLGLWYADIYSADDMKAAMRRLVSPLKAGIQGVFEPYSDWAKDGGDSFKDDEGVKSRKDSMKRFMRNHLGLDDEPTPVNLPPSMQRR